MEALEVKKLGLIGGIGPESTIPYYRGIMYGVQSRVAKDFFPSLTIESLNVFEILDKCHNEDYGALISYLMTAIHNLEASGVDFVAMSGNTPHIVFEELKKRSKIPLVSIVEATCNRAKQHNFSKIGLLGTIFTMEGEFFRKPFLDNNIEIVTPTHEEKIYINQMISQELELGIVREETRDTFIKIIQRMRDENEIEAIVLGCTELPLLFNGVDISIEVLDTMQIHIQALIDLIIEG